ARTQSEWVADRDREVADLELGGVGEDGGLKVRARDLDHGEVVGWKRADERRWIALAVRGRHGERAPAADDVVVRDDVAGSGEDDPRAEALLVLDLHDRRRHRPHDVDERILKRASALRDRD